MKSIIEMWSISRLVLAKIWLWGLLFALYYSRINGTATTTTTAAAAGPTAAAVDPLTQTCLSTGVIE